MMHKSEGRSRVEGRSPRVALLVETSRTYGRGILRGIARYAHVNGPWSLYIQERELHSGIPEWLRLWRGDGVIARIEDRPTALGLMDLKCPIVDVLGNQTFETIPSFDTDAALVAKCVADFFLNAGFRNIAFCGYQGIPFSERRAAEFVRYLASLGHQVRLFKTRSTPKALSHIQAIEQRGLTAEPSLAAWLRKQPGPLAVFACNDIRGQQVLNACREYGIKVPEEVAVVGVDNDDVLCALCEPPLSSVEPDTERLGYEAAALLDKMMRDGSGGSTVVQIPPARLVERASTDIVAIEDPVTAQAVRFIRDNVGKGIAVKDVMIEVGRSRTDLEQRFRRLLKRSVRGEIVRCRMERVCILLRQTNLNLTVIAERVGFSSTAHLCRLFQQHHHKTPTEYRLDC
jgi:LacI family transcriptional regulator